MRTSESTTAIITALVAARAAFAPVMKDTKGQVGQNREYRYAALPGILDAVLPALSEHGICVVQAVDAETSSLSTRLAHISGEWLESSYPLHLDQTPQQLGSELTYARRYSLQSLLCLAAEDDDGASASTKQRTRQQPASAPAPRQAAPEPTTVPARPTPQPEAPPVAPAASQDAPESHLISEPQRKRLFAINRSAGRSANELKDLLAAEFGVSSSAAISKVQYTAICARVERPLETPEQAQRREETKAKYGAAEPADGMLDHSDIF